MTSQITEKRLYNITLFYLTRYESSTEKVRQMLKRRLYKAAQADIEIPPQSTQWIENVIQKMQELGYLNDTRFAANQVRILARQGKSSAFIINKLKQSGIDSTTVTSFLQEEEGDDLARAHTWLKHHKKGVYRTQNAADFYTKDLASLGRAGFSYETARCALKKTEETDDE